MKMQTTTIESRTPRADAKIRVCPHCRTPGKRLYASIEEPLHYPRRGLSNLYLVGISHLLCQHCGRSEVAIPAVGALMRAVARALVAKRAALIGAEIQFLRNRLGLKSIEFARMLGVTPQHFSRWENSRSIPSSCTDRLIRLSYVFLARDEELRSSLATEFTNWTSSIRSIRKQTKIIAELNRGKLWSARIV